MKGIGSLNGIVKQHELYVAQELTFEVGVIATLGTNYRTDNPTGIHNETCELCARMDCDGRQIVRKQGRTR